MKSNIEALKEWLSAKKNRSIIKLTTYRSDGKQKKPIVIMH